MKTRDSTNEDFVAKVCELNVKVQIKQIMHSSDIIEDLLNEKKIGLIGGVYNISTGQVNFLQDTLLL